MGDTTNNTPLIVTIQLEEAQQKFFNALRTQYYPAHTNFLDAHLTLFHRLPSGNAFIIEKLQEFSQRDPIKLTVSSVYNMGNGVAYTITSPELHRLHLSMQKIFRTWLIKKDRLRLWPHITIQNKVTAYKAQQLQQKLATDFKPLEINATGIAAWLYMKGPWQEIQSFPFIK